MTTWAVRGAAGSSSATSVPLKSLSTPRNCCIWSAPMRWGHFSSNAQTLARATRPTAHLRSDVTCLNRAVGRPQDGLDAGPQIRPGPSRDPRPSSQLSASPAARCARKPGVPSTRSSPRPPCGSRRPRCHRRVVTEPAALRAIDSSPSHVDLHHHPGLIVPRQVTGELVPAGLGECPGERLRLAGGNVFNF
jgi:hypothetical protein